MTRIIRQTERDYTAGTTRRFRPLLSVALCAILALVALLSLNAPTVGATSARVAVSTTTALSSSPNPSVFGQPVTLTASVTGTTPTGTVAFFDGATPLGTGALSGGVATITTGSLAVGSHSFTAVYGGDPNNNGSTSPVATQTVSQAATSTSLTSAPNPSVFGQPVTLTANVTVVPPGAGTPSGTVSFFDGATLLGTGALSNGVATLTTSSLAAGSRALTAVYNGDANDSGSTSPVDTQVNQIATSTSLTRSPNPSVYGQPVTLTAQVTSFAGTPTGSVTFYDGDPNSSGVQLGAAVPLSGGSASTTTTAISGGSRTIFAVYTPDTSNFSGSQGSIGQTVLAAHTVTTLTSNGTAYIGTDAYLTVVVKSTGASTAVPTGTVQFYEISGSSRVFLGCLSLNNGQATLDTEQFTGVVGGHTIQAIYSPANSANFQASQSGYVIQSVRSCAATAFLPLPNSPLALMVRATSSSSSIQYQEYNGVRFTVSNAKVFECTSNSNGTGSVEISGTIATVNASGLNSGIQVGNQVHLTLYNYGPCGFEAQIQVYGNSWWCNDIYSSANSNASVVITPQ
ncbi:MAG: hypothetical protein JWO59_2368, partial [Chloroflexi bacterium]|nr:hypothetical protein [Chloroflexota bacterium]